MRVISWESPESRVYYCNLVRDESLFSKEEEDMLYIRPSDINQSQMSQSKNYYENTNRIAEKFPLPSWNNLHLENVI